MARAEPVLELLKADFFSGVPAIVALDLVLAGDSAIITMAVRALPAALQHRAMFRGSFGAIAVQLPLTPVLVHLLGLPGLMSASLALRLPIARKRLRENRSSEQDGSAPNTFWAALGTIIAVDALMQMDHMLAAAESSRGSYH